MASSIAPKNLRFWHGLQGIGMALLGMIGFLLLWQLLVQFGLKIPQSYALSIQTVFISASFAIGGWYGVARTGNPVSTIVGLQRAHPIFFVAAGFGVIFAGALGDEVVSVLHRWKPTFFDMGSMEEIAQLLQQISPVSFVVLAFCVSFFPAIGEELMFRGLVFRSFHRDMPLHFAVIYSSILFGVVHFSWLQGTAAALLGAYLAVVVFLGGSMYPVIFAHFVNNLTWCLLTRYEPLWMERILREGHSGTTIAICVFMVAVSVLTMLHFSNRKL